MSQNNNRLPPIVLNSPSGRRTDLNETNETQRVVRPRRNRQQQQQQQQRSRSEQTTPSSSTNLRRGADNPAFSSNNNNNNNDEDERGRAESETITRRQRRKRADTGEERTSKKPPRAAKKGQLNTKIDNFVSNVAYLQGLEEDVVNYDDEPDENDESTTTRNQQSDQQQSDISQKDLLDSSEKDDKGGDAPESSYYKSTPTDKFYLELEKKFATQKKELYEKRKQERLAQMFEIQLRELQREDLKYQISTPRTALYTHKFIRTIFLFVHGINVGFQFWQVILIYFLNASPFIVDKTKDTKFNDFYYTYLSTLSPLLTLYQNLAMPFQCLSYFFLVICIVDCMDR